MTKVLRFRFRLKKELYGGSRSVGRTRVGHTYGDWNEPVSASGSEGRMFGFGERNCSSSQGGHHDWTVTASHSGGAVSGNDGRTGTNAGI